MRRIPLLSAAAIAALALSPAIAGKKKDEAPKVQVGRTPMAPVETIAQALPAIGQHATLARLLDAAQLTPTLAGPGPYTLFAPSDDAFARLAPGTVDTLAKPENAASLATVLKYHVVNGAYTGDQIKALITQGGGTAALPTLSGQSLTATLENGNIVLTDVSGGKSYVSQPDLREANGIVHVTNGLSVPKLG